MFCVTAVDHCVWCGHGVLNRVFREDSASNCGWQSESGADAPGIPQLDPATDIFNHSAYAYWSMMVPGEDAWGHIVCTGWTLPLPLPSAFLGFAQWLPFSFAFCLFSQGYYTCQGQLAHLTELQSSTRKHDDFLREFGASSACCIHWWDCVAHTLNWYHGAPSCRIKLCDAHQALSGSRLVPHIHHVWGLCSGSRAAGQEVQSSLCARVPGSGRSSCHCARHFPAAVKVSDIWDIIHTHIYLMMYIISLFIDIVSLFIYCYIHH